MFLMSKNVLNSPLEKFTRLLFSRVIERLAIMVNQEDLGFSQVAALHIIDRESGISVNELASRLNLSISATSRMVEELVKKEFLNREEVLDNRRLKTLTLTSHGKRFMNTLSLERVKIIEDVALSFSDKIPQKILKIVSTKLFIKGNK